MGGVRSNLILVAASAAAAGLVAAAVTEVPLVDGAPATRVKLLPMGEIKLRDGRGPYQLRDQAHADEVVAATKTFLGSLDFSFDYNHAVTIAGSDARASGWCSKEDLTAEADGIYANNVQWTPAALKALADREFRYISPLFMAQPVKAGGAVTHLKNAALVTIGAIDLPAVAAGLFGEEDHMDLAALAALLGLGADATAESVAAAIGTLKSSTALTPVAAALGLPDAATIEQIAAGITALKAEKTPDLSGYVPKDVAEGMKAELATLRTKRLGETVDALVAAGVVPPMKRQGALDWFEKDEVAATAFYKDMPAVVQPGSQLGERKSTDKPTKLTDEQRQVAASCGLSEDEYLAELQEEVA